MTQAYPLQWPTGRPRTARPTRSRFDMNLAKSRDGLIREVGRMGARSAVLSTNVSLRLDGKPYANQPEPEDPGVCVYFTLRGRQLAFACDRWDRVRDNIHAIRKTIEALRGIKRWGTCDMAAAAFTGFTALPAPPDWRVVLELDDPRITMDAVNARYRVLAKHRHPDNGGTVEAFQQLTAAVNAARQELAP